MHMHCSYSDIFEKNAYLWLAKIGGHITCVSSITYYIKYNILEPFSPLNIKYHHHYLTLNFFIKQIYAFEIWQLYYNTTIYIFV